MIESHSRKPRALTARRLALLGTTILGLTAGTFFVAPGLMPGGQHVLAQTQNIARPVGFADIVERVKPAVIAVRVRTEARSSSGNSQVPPGSEMDEFFRRFGPDGQPPRGRGYSTGQGSGFFISADGFAVTNNHVVDKATTVQITTDDGKTYPAKVIGVDQRTDLALIKVEGNNFPFVRFSERVPRVGDWVLAVGNPFGLGGTVTAGIVSARGRDIGSGPYDDYLQIDAPVNKGNSGGPTFDVDGGVIGVNTAIFSPSGGSVGIAFAIPAATVKSVVAQLKDKGSVLRGWIGVQVQAITPEVAQNLGLKRTDGALVTEPQQNSPAQKAGITAGDIILAVNGSPVKDSRDLAKRIGNMSPGTNVQLVVLSKGQERSVSVTLGELPPVQEVRTVPSEPNARPRRDREDSQRGPERQDRQDRGERRRFRDQDSQRGPERDDDETPGPRSGRRGDTPREFMERFDERYGQRGDRQFGERQYGDRSAPRGERGEQRGDRSRLGLSLQPGANAGGVVVAAVEPNSRASELGFQAGDVIIEVDGKPVATPQDLRQALRDARADGKNTVAVKVKSQQGTRTINLPIGRA